MGHKEKKLKNKSRESRRILKRPDPHVYSREEFLKSHIYRSRKWVVTNEDWYPNYNEKQEADRENGNFVEVNLIHMGHYNPGKKIIDHTGWRVCVWGADDFGMEIDVDTKDEAQILFDRVVNLTTREQLRSWGFDNA